MTVETLPQKSGKVESTNLKIPLRDPKIFCGDSCNANFDSGEIITLKATAPDGYQIKQWVDSKTGIRFFSCDKNAECTVQMPDKDLSIKVEFDRPDNKRLQVKKIIPRVLKNPGRDPGSIKDEQSRIDCGPTCEAVFTEGEEVTLTARAEDGLRAQYWKMTPTLPAEKIKGGCTTDSPSCTIIIPGRDTTRVEVLYTADETSCRSVSNPCFEQDGCEKTPARCDAMGNAVAPYSGLPKWEEAGPTSDMWPNMLQQGVSHTGEPGAECGVQVEYESDQAFVVLEDAKPIPEDLRNFHAALDGKETIKDEVFLNVLPSILAGAQFSKVVLKQRYKNSQATYFTNYRYFRGIQFETGEVALFEKDPDTQRWGLVPGKTASKEWLKDKNLSLDEKTEILAQWTVENQYLDRQIFLLNSVEFLARLFPGVYGVEQVVRGEHKVMGAISAVADIASLGIGSKITVFGRTILSSGQCRAVVGTGAGARIGFNLFFNGKMTTGSYIDTGLAIVEGALVGLPIIKIAIKNGRGFIASTSQVEGSIIAKIVGTIGEAGLTAAQLKKLGIVVGKKISHIWPGGTVSPQRLKAAIEKIARERGVCSSQITPEEKSIILQMEQQIIRMQQWGYSYQEALERLKNTGLVLSGPNTANTIQVMNDGLIFKKGYHLALHQVASAVLEVLRKKFPKWENMRPADRVTHIRKILDDYFSKDDLDKIMKWLIEGRPGNQTVRDVIVEAIANIVPSQIHMKLYRSFSFDGKVTIDEFIKNCLEKLSAGYSHTGLGITDVADFIFKELFKGKKGIEPVVFEILEGNASGFVVNGKGSVFVDGKNMQCVMNAANGDAMVPFDTGMIGALYEVVGQPMKTQVFDRFANITRSVWLVTLRKKGGR